MRLICLMGTRLRHRYMLAVLARHFKVVGVVFQERTLVAPPKLDAGLFAEEDIQLHLKHLKRLEVTEEMVFGEEAARKGDFDHITVQSKKELNAPGTIAWVGERKPDVVFDYGSMILSRTFLSHLPPWCINLHGGLSPWYRGSATLLWPLYFQQPELLGITFHLLAKQIDGGAILQHFRPEVNADDMPADLGCRAIHDGAETAVALLQKLDRTGTLNRIPQRSAGKLFLEQDYKPSHLQVVYDNLERGLLARYLKHKAAFDAPYRFTDQLGLM